MSKFSELQKTHEKLVRKEQAQEDILEQVHQYLKEIQNGSSQISKIREREQLRANLRYWASYVYEKTRIYPNVDLLPSLKPDSTGLRTFFFGLATIIGLAFICILVYVSIALPQRQAMIANITAQANISTQSAQIATNQANISIRPEITHTPVAVSTSMTAQPYVVSVQIESIRDGEQISPVQIIGGTYLNLNPGSSIHLIVQPISKAGLRYVMQQYVPISRTSTSGEWAIEAKFGQGIELKNREDYVIFVVVCPDEETRNALIGQGDVGFVENPPGLMSFSQKIYVTREAYTVAIDGVQIIYSTYLTEVGNSEIFTMDLDGKNVHRITYTSGISELFPSLSPDGKQIAYVGRKRDAQNNPLYTIEIINADGSDRQVIVDETPMLLERPLWSSDGTIIAYAVGTVRGERPTHWNIFAYDIKNQKRIQITQGEQTSNRYFSWVPGSSEIVFDARMRLTGTSGFIRVDIFNLEDESVFFDTIGEELQPAISPDGTKLVYMQLDRVGDNWRGNLYLADLSTEKKIQLTNSVFQDWYPSWSPDGKTIVFASFQSGAQSIWSISVDGSNLRQLTLGGDHYPFVGYMYALIP